jgi:large subunit ribosomal protein L5
MTTLKERYIKDVRPALAKELGLKNPMALPKVVSVTVAVGLSQGLKDPKFTENAESVVTRITGQKAVRTKAKISISNFKIREGMVVGLRVTLRGERMWSFLDKLVNITFPRIRDFRGISPKLLDKNGNMSIGFKEFLPFPEIRPDEVERVHGLQVTISTTAGNKKAGEALFTALGFPFKKD